MRTAQAVTWRCSECHEPIGIYSAYQVVDMYGVIALRRSRAGAYCLPCCRLQVAHVEEEARVRRLPIVS